MNAQSFLLVPALLAPIFLASNAPATRVHFAPAEGSSLTKTFENKANLSLDEYTISGTGGGQAPEMEMTFTTTQKVVVTDAYVKNREGAPAKLERTYDELSGDMSMTMKMSIMGQTQSNDQNMRSKSELEGKKVVFAWDAEKSEYTKTLEPKEDKPDLLKPLTEDMDFRGLLPAGEVKEGDEWDIPLDSLNAVLTPGGNLALVPENADEKSIKMGSEMASMSNMIGDKLEGTAKGKLVALKEVDGVKVGAIHIDLKIHSSADMTETARKALAGADVPKEVSSLEIDHLDIEFKFEGEGELLWNLEAGHLHTFDLSGQTTIKSEQGMNLEVAGKKMSIQENRSMSGTSSFSAKAK